MQFLADQWHVDTTGQNYVAGEKQTKIQISTETNDIMVFMDEGKSFIPEIYIKTCTHLERHTELPPHCLQSYHILSVTI